jgi:hypothetical protein
MQATDQISAFRFRRLLQEALNSLGRLGSTAKPIVNPVAFESQLGRMSAGVVMTQDLNKTPIAGSFAIDHDDSVAWLLFGSRSSQTNSQQTSSF